MNKRKTFICIFAGVVAAGLLGLGLAFLLRALITGNAIVTIVTLFMMIAGGIMAGIGLISMLICLVLLAFGDGGKNNKEIAVNNEGDDSVNNVEKTETTEDKDNIQSAESIEK